MDLINNWAARWGISPAAVADLYASMPDQPEPRPEGPETEAGVQQAVRLEASRRGMRLWRNNVGACQDQNGNFIRYGLANDSKKVNGQIKSADLIGITPHVVVPGDIGRKVGIFTSIEVKAPGWRYRGTKREKAQFNWMQLVAGLGGKAIFATDAGQI